jgi:hypothetical protein
MQIHLLRPYHPELLLPYNLIYKRLTENEWSHLRYGLVHTVGLL